MTENETLSILKEIKKGTAEIISEKELIKKLQSGKPLIVKAGFDPTASDLHLGHTVLLTKLRQLQNFGHQIIFLIGDFTAMIGDPTGRNVTRPSISQETVLENAKTYQDQVFKILDESKTKVVFNSEWLSKMTPVDFIKLTSNYTVARVLERDDFAKRFKSNTPISVHEFIYPLLQGYDSVMLKADIELGGNDQKFNLIVGRELQKSYGMEPQVVITMPLLEGTDGVNKMSKSYGNYIGIKEAPADMYGKLMSISDDLMWKYFDLLSFKSVDEIAKLKNDVANGLNPKTVKMLLAWEITERFHGQDAAQKAQDDFVNRFSKNKLPEVKESLEIKSADHEMPLANLLKQANLVTSTSEAMRLIKQNAVSIDGQKVTENLLIKAGEEHLYLVGKKKFAKIKFN